MSEERDIQADIARALTLARDKLGIRAETLQAAIPRLRRLLPRSIRTQAVALADAEPRLGHPKLRLTVNNSALARSADILLQHLQAIDKVDRIKGWWLGMLGGLAFNLILFIVLLIALLVWRGIL